VVSRQLHFDELALVESFALCELSLDDLCQKVRDELGSGFRHNEKMRWVNLNQICPTPIVRITRRHVENALAKRRDKQISERHLVDWATMILINDCYFWEGEDADVVAEWVDSISLDLVPED
jgi:hypothetical protein